MTSRDYRLCKSNLRICREGEKKRERRKLREKMSRIGKSFCAHYALSRSLLQHCDLVELAVAIQIDRRSSARWKSRECGPRQGGSMAKRDRAGLIAAIINGALLVISRFRCSNICPTSSGWPRCRPIRINGRKVSTRQREETPIGGGALAHLVVIINEGTPDISR